MSYGDATDGYRAETIFTRRTLLFVLVTGAIGYAALSFSERFLGEDAGQLVGFVPLLLWSIVGLIRPGLRSDVPLDARGRRFMRLFHAANVAGIGAIFATVAWDSSIAVSLGIVAGWWLVQGLLWTRRPSSLRTDGDADYTAPHMGAVIAACAVVTLIFLAFQWSL